MGEISDRFSKYMTSRDLNDNQVTNNLGLSIGLLGKSRKPGSDLSKKSIEKILNFYADLNKVWLLTGEGDMINAEFIPNHSGEEEAISSISKSIPYWNLPVSAGKSVLDIIGKTKPDGFIKGLPGADIAENILPVIGTSMEPEVSSGAIIGVRKMNNWESLNTERIYLIITTDDRMIKRIEYDETNQDIIWCVSPNYPRFKIYKSDIIDIQRVCFVYNPK